MVASFKKIVLLLIVFTVFAIADSPVVDQRKHVVGDDTLNLADGDEVQRLMDGLHDELNIIKRTKAILNSRIKKVEKDILLLNQGDYEFYSHTHPASDIVSGILDEARYHAYNDLVAESKIGHGSGQIVGGPEFLDSIGAMHDVMRDTATVVWNDSASAIRTYVQTIVEDSLDEYSLTTWIQAQIDTLNNRIDTTNNTADSIITNCCP